MNIRPLLDTLGIQEDAARALADDLRTQITELQARLREAETHLEHLAITRKTVTALSGRLPAHPDSPDLPEHPDYPRILAVLNEATGPLRARDVCEALDHELLPKNIEGTPRQAETPGQARHPQRGRRRQLHQEPVVGRAPRSTALTLSHPRTTHSTTAS
ncbi:hypothetical protein [Streptomyces sp. NPDC005077]|uniref:hypothetical protein n=1 Tax=Streptomyces sp. NPDC005077 TaxID=3154292 RepID=UPI0033A26C98